MTWKSTAVVSGAGLLATWLAGVPAPAPAVAPHAAPRAASQTEAPASSEIAGLAERLERRTRAVRVPATVSRNPFRFEAPRPDSRSAPMPPPVVEEPLPEDRRPRLRFSGLAMGRPDDQTTWTAIISTPDGVILARAGERVAGTFRVLAIEPESLTLQDIDGGELHLPLSGR